MDNYDSLRSVIPFSKSPYKMYNIENNLLIPLFKNINNLEEKKILSLKRWDILCYFEYYKSSSNIMKIQIQKF